MDPWRNAFGQLLVDPDRLSMAVRVEELRRLAGVFQGLPDLGTRWLGRAVRTYLQTGCTLEAALRIVPEPGSRLTAAALVRREVKDHALLQLAVAAGTDARASAIARGDPGACPVSCQEALAAVVAAAAPVSVAAIGRARNRSRPRA